MSVLLDMNILSYSPLWENNVRSDTKTIMFCKFFVLELWHQVLNILSFSWKQSIKWQLNCFCCFVKTYFVKKIEHLCFELQCFWVFSTFETILEYFIVLHSVLEGLDRFWNVLDFWSVLDFFRLFYSMVFMCFRWFLECL